jgi:predicted dehydrogenase
MSDGQTCVAPTLSAPDRAERFVTQLLRAGVAGAGSFGRHHARIYAETEGVALVGVYDPHLERAHTVADPHGARGLNDLDAFLAEIDILTIAAPASTHAGLALAALAASKAVYVEKPLAVSLDDADKIIALAAKSGVVLACGHQERVASKALGILDIPERPSFLEAVRKGPWSPRNADVSTILDLMIHDIDLVLALNPSAPLAVEAEGRITQGPFIDEARAEITLDDGSSIVLEASRIAEHRERRMRVVYPSGEVEIDFVTRAFRNTTPFALDEHFTETPAGHNPLAASVRAFIAAVRGEADRPAVTGEEAARALDLALAVEQACGL